LFRNQFPVLFLIAQAGRDNAATRPAPRVGGAIQAEENPNRARLGIHVISPGLGRGNQVRLDDRFENLLISREISDHNGEVHLTLGDMSDSTEKSKNESRLADGSAKQSQVAWEPE
jgi:hypothetical protein